MLTHPQLLIVKKVWPWKDKPGEKSVTLPVLMSQALISGLKPPHKKMLCSFG